MERYRSAIIAIFVLSGLSGLVYEIVWSRQLVLIFGNTTQAVAAILTGYFGGMAIGSLLGGRLADRVPSGLRLYAGLELLLVGVVLVTPALFGLVRTLHGIAYDALAEQGLALTASRFVLALIALAPATILMGATLPSLARHIARRANELGDVFGRLYAANTVGAALGALLAGFFLVELLGLTGSLVAGAVGSALAGVIALALSRIENPLRDVQEEAVGAPSHSSQAQEQPFGAVSLDPQSMRRLALLVAFVSGLTSLGYQTLWTRLLSSGTGSLSYVFSSILVFFLVGLALGPLIVAAGSRRGLPTLPWLGAAQLAIAALATAGTVLIAWRPVELSTGLTWALVVLPTATVIGMSLPLAARVVPSRDRHVGSDAGAVLATNTAGVVLGTVAIPFLAMPTIGSPMTVVVLAGANVALGAVLLGLASRPGRRRRPAIASAATGALVVAVAASGLVIDPAVEAIRARGQLFASAEDEIASVQAGTIGEARHLWVAGTSMTALTVDAELMAILPTIARPAARDTLVIAFGMGSSYRTALRLGQRVEGVELVPSVPGMFRWFHEDADAVLADPNGRLLITDGRNHVELTRRTFDIIIVDPPPPIESAGTGVLYSREFYEASRSRLRPDGVVMMWIPYGQTLAEFLTHVRTFGAVFPETTLAFGPGGNGVFMLGSAAPVSFSSEAVREVLSRPGIVEDLDAAPDAPTTSAGAWAALIPDLLIASGDDVDDVAGLGDVITDDRPLTEYFLLRRVAAFAQTPMAFETVRDAFAGR